MPLCECGCGEKVKNKFVHGHNRKSSYMKKHCSEETRKMGEKISLLHKDPNGPYGKDYKKKQGIIAKKRIEEERKNGLFDIRNKKISKTMKGNKNGRFISTEAKIKRIKKTRYKKKDWEEKHPLFSKEEEIRDFNGYIPGRVGIEVRCKFCRKWFVPTKQQLDSRIRAIEYDFNGGGCYLYCSDECKGKCPHFNLYVLSVLKTEHERPTSTDYGVFRKEVLKRANYECEYCGNPAEDVHHIRPFKYEPFFALDVDFGIAVCKKCHNKYGHKDECSMWNIANTICT
jgi:hypothetical protein